jgi:hypothetical protein
VTLYDEDSLGSPMTATIGKNASCQRRSSSSRKFEKENGAFLRGPDKLQERCLHLNVSLGAWTVSLSGWGRNSLVFLLMPDNYDINKL